MTKKDYKIAIFGGVIAVISSGVYDYIKEKPILTTTKSFFIWIWDNIFELELKIWQILIGIIIIAIIYALIKASKTETPAKFTDYTRDIIHGTEWTWQWDYDILEGKWGVKNINPICDNNCGTRMDITSSFGPGVEAKCPRCDNRMDGLKDTRTIEALILDNIRQDLHLSKIEKK